MFSVKKKLKPLVKIPVEEKGGMIKNFLLNKGNKQTKSAVLLKKLANSLLEMM